MKQVRVLLVENDREILKSIRSYLENKPDIEIVGVARNGKEAIEMLPVVHAEVMVTDLVMPIMDGFEVLEYLQHLTYPPAPKVIILSGLAKDTFVSQAIELGAYYYLCKPCDLSILYKRIIEHAKFVQPAFLTDEPPASKAPANEINTLLDAQGISNAIRGYGYLHTAIELGVVYGELSGRITKELYPAVARMHGTTIGKVERAIRHAIERGWERGNLKKTGFETANRPSNGEYIAKMVRLVSSQQDMMQ